MGEHAAAGLVSLADRHDFRPPEIALVSELLMEIEDLDTMTTLTDNELREIVLQNKLPEEHIERHHMLRVLQSNGIGLINVLVQRADDRLIAQCWRWAAPCADEKADTARRMVLLVRAPVAPRLLSLYATAANA